MTPHPELDEFVAWLGSLDGAGIAAAARDLDRHAADPVEELSWWETMVEVERRLRAQRAGRAASLATMVATRAVTRAAGVAGMPSDDPRVITVSRAAASVARALVASVEGTDPLLPGWHTPTAA